MSNETKLITGTFSFLQQLTLETAITIQKFFIFQR